MQRILYLHKQLGKEPPPLTDKCAWLLLKRAFKEAMEADQLIFETKVIALKILVLYGWRDVFKESLNANGEFRSAEEHGRFENCLNL